MPDRSAPALSRQMKTSYDMIALVEAVAERDPDFAGQAEIGELLRMVPGDRVVLDGSFGGAPAVYRVYVRDGPEQAARYWNELLRIWPHMSSGNLRVTKPLYYAPEHGLVVIEKAPGTPLLKHIWNSEGPERVRYIRPAAAWLRRYTGPTEEPAPARHASWLERVHKASETQPFEDLRRAEIAILAQLERLADAAITDLWRAAISHGDYHPNNLVVDGDRLTGIDTGGSSRLPIYKDIARFLVHMGRRCLIPSGDSWLGVDRYGFDMFADEFALSAEDRTITLPFMIGIEALIRVESKGMSSSRIRRAGQFYDALLADLKSI